MLESGRRCITSLGNLLMHLRRIFLQNLVLTNYNALRPHMITSLNFLFLGGTCVNRSTFAVLLAQNLLLGKLFLTVLTLLILLCIYT